MHCEQAMPHARGCALMLCRHAMTGPMGVRTLKICREDICTSATAVQSWLEYCNGLVELEFKGILARVQATNPSTDVLDMVESYRTDRWFARE